MTEQAKRYRVPVDFPENERAVLAALCSQDYRPPEDQVRYLVIQEARRRGLLDPPRNEARECARVAETGGALPLVQS